MDAFGLTLLGMTFVGALTALWWRWQREHRLVETYHAVQCPVHESRARVTVRTDPGAPSCRQHVRVTTCSLRSDAATGLPERVAYLADSPPYRIRLAPAVPHPVYTGEVECPQHCVFVLNETAVSNALPPVECSSGACDAIDLMRQTIRNPRISQLLYYYGQG